MESGRETVSPARLPELYDDGGRCCGVGRRYVVLGRWAGEGDAGSVLIYARHNRRRY